MRRWGLFRLVAFALVAAAVALAVRKQRQLRQAEPVRAQAARPEPVGPSTSKPDVDFLGVLLSGQTVELAPRLEGRLEHVLVRPGDHVTKGAPIARLDVRSVRADLNLAVSNLADAEQRLSRRIPLAAGVISAEELADARAQVTDRRNRVEQLKASIADALMPAPFDAVVAARYVDPGAFVGPHRPVVRLLSGGGIRVRFAIPETEAARVAIRAPVQITVKSGGERFTGVVESLAPEVDAAARMIFAVATVDVPSEAKGRLFSGMVARVSPL